MFNKTVALTAKTQSSTQTQGLFHCDYNHTTLATASSMGPPSSLVLFKCTSYQDTRLWKYPVWSAGFGSIEQRPTSDFALDSNTKDAFLMNANFFSSVKFSPLDPVHFPPADLMHVRDVILLDAQLLVVPQQARDVLHFHHLPVANLQLVVNVKLIYLRTQGWQYDFLHISYTTRKKIFNV